MNSSLIPRRLTQPKTLLVLVIAIVVLGFISVSGSKNGGSQQGSAVKPGKFAGGEQRRSTSSGASASKKNNEPVMTEDGNIDYCEILREPMLLNQRSHWDNFAENPKGRIETPDRSTGDIGNWFGTLAYFSSIEAQDLESPNRFFTSCELACAQHEECVSFLYERYLTEIADNKYIDKHRDRCYLNKRFQYGTERMPVVDTHEKLGDGEVWNGRSWTAGWHRDRAERWLIEEKGCVRPTKKPSRRERQEAEEREKARQEEEAAAAARAKIEAEAQAQQQQEASAAVAAANPEEHLGAEMMG